MAYHHALSQEELCYINLLFSLSLVHIQQITAKLGRAPPVRKVDGRTEFSGSCPTKTTGDSEIWHNLLLQGRCTCKSW